MRATRRVRLVSALVTALVYLAVFAPSSAGAQSEAQLWTETGVRVRLHRRLRLESSTLLRTEEGLSGVGRAMQDVGLDLRLTRALRLGSGYRLAWLPEDGQRDEWRHRVHLDVKLRGEVGRLRISPRLRWQGRFQDGDEPQHTLRARLDVSVDTDSLVSPYVSAEVFARVRDETSLRLHAWRATLGIEVDLGDHELDLFYRVEIPRDASDPKLHIVGIGHRFDVPH